MGDIERYIIEFLCYGDTKVAQRVRLSSDVDWTLRYPQLDQVPAMERVGDEVIVSPDLIYNTFFFISRAEELLNDKRDKHGRFMASYSILGEKNRLQTPLIDEYSRVLLKTLDAPLPTAEFSAINLTHDVDTIAYYHHLRGALGGIKRGHWKDVYASWKDIHKDPAFTFPWMMKQDAQVPNANIIFFLKDTRGKGIDYPQYKTSLINRLSTVNQPLNTRKKQAVYFGLHSSALEAEAIAYRGNISPIDYTLHRSHYLSCSVDRMQKLVDFGVTDDYTMAFPDQAGFRLQTTRPIRWINPKTITLTPLTLHPLTIMDCTLSNANYMNLSEDEAFIFVTLLIERVRQHNGELNLLWHNSIFCDSYHKSLYPKILSSL
ncbi:MAG: hypothetical protein KBS70_00585 [Bacteroidales bacterium]|nr:hypothetical protein [Candidatus Colicola equi]